MSKSIRYALRFLVIVAVVVSVSSLIGPSTERKSPYLSALSDFTATSLWAAKVQCQNKICTGTFGTCVDELGSLCHKSQTGRCIASTCG